MDQPIKSNLFNNVYDGKKVLITGHTGFKGSWLTKWLINLGAEVIGISNGIPTNPSLFDIAQIKNHIIHIEEDIRNLDILLNSIRDHNPDFVFHLAAQAIVSTSFKEPINTITSNVLGTANVLEALRILNQKCAVVIVTSDKCYENMEWIWGYKETDMLGGKDIYSGSKACAEIIFNSYYRSFFSTDKSNVSIATGRAGNVIGGGDWAKDRLIPDIMNKWSKGLKVEIRFPTATRPWQHVLEPLSGYLHLASQLLNRKELSGQSFNFGPSNHNNYNVMKIVKDMSEQWGFDSSHHAFSITNNSSFNEAGLLKLNCDKALNELTWIANLDYDDCVKFVTSWYKNFYKIELEHEDITLHQIKTYERIAKSKKLVWTQN